MGKTIEDGFTTLLSWLKPLSTEQDMAKSHKDSVKSCLEKSFKCYDFQEIGSFGNGTGVRHFSDTDYLSVCPANELTNNSSYTLKKFKEALQGTFWKTEGIEVSTPSVIIPFGNYASETLEVTPCNFIGLIETTLGKKGVYEIPNYSDGWMNSSPAAHNAYVRKQDERLNGKLKPLIQLIKAWKFYCNVPITSFYLELRVAKYSESEKSIIYDFDIKRIISQLNDNKLASIIDPMGISGYVHPCKTEVKKEDALSKLSTALIRAEKALALRDKNLDDCFYWWKLFFNGEFPSR